MYKTVCSIYGNMYYVHFYCMHSIHYIELHTNTAKFFSQFRIALSTIILSTGTQSLLLVPAHKHC